MYGVLFQCYKWSPTNVNQVRINLHLKATFLGWDPTLVRCHTGCVIHTKECHENNQGKNLR
jgi:hypothetical protein